MLSKGPIPFPILELQTEQKQHFNLTQRLMMSTHMQQALHLLQLPLLELTTFIEEQVVLNPLLEITDETTIKEKTEEEEQEEAIEDSPEDFFLEKEIIIDEQNFNILKSLEEEFKDYFAETNTFQLKRSSEEEKHKTYLENSICNEVNLYQKLIQEAHHTFETPHDLQIAEILIGYIDEYGFLKTPLQEIAALHNFKQEELSRILREIQTFEPYGVGASAIQDCLLIQLRCLNKEHTLAYNIIEKHYEDLLHHRIPAIRKSLRCSFSAIQQAIDKDIAKLDLHPGIHFSSRKVPPLIPDVSLNQVGEQLIVDVNRDHAPNLRLNNYYLKMLEDPNIPLETKNFIRHHIFSARWLMRNLQQRYSTVERIAASLAHRQYEFFTQPNGKLVPLTMRTIAEELHVHESTIARTVSNKYLHSPRGLMPLKAFFTYGYRSENGKDLSSQTIRDAILEIIQTENKENPLSDAEICVLLKQKGLLCARRTVTKYRASLHIGNALQRKKF